MLEQVEHPVIIKLWWLKEAQSGQLFEIRVLRSKFLCPAAARNGRHRP